MVSIPSKHKMKEGLRKQFRSILTDPRVHYFGNIEVGTVGDITFKEIREMGFSAILVTAGAQAARHLGVPGEELKGVFHAKDVVYHYNQLPPYGQMDYGIGKKVAVVGAGNVMLDLAHWLIDEVQVEEVIAVVRRGPAEVKFDKKELENVIVNLDTAALDEELKRVTPVMLSVGEDPEEIRAFYRSTMEKAGPRVSRTRFWLKFLSSPRLLVGDEQGRLKGLVVEETTLQESHGAIKAVGTGSRILLTWTPSSWRSATRWIKTWGCRWMAASISITQTRSIRLRVSLMRSLIHPPENPGMAYFWPAGQDRQALDWSVWL